MCDRKSLEERKRKETVNEFGVPIDCLELISSDDIYLLCVVLQTRL